MIYNNVAITRLARLENVQRFIATLPVYELKSVFVNGTEIKKFKAVCYKNTNHVVAIVSDKYKLVQHQDVFNFVLNKLKEKYEEENIKGWVQHTKTKAYLFVTFNDVTVDDDSDYKCGLLVTNSVNSQLSIWTNLFLYRLTCSNGIIQPKNLLEVQNKHLGLENFWDRFSSRFSIMLDRFNDMLKQEFNFLQTIKDYYVKVDVILGKLNGSKKAYFIIKAKLKTEDSLFNIYQAITNYYTNNLSLNITSRVNAIRKARILVEDCLKQLQHERV